MISREEQRRLDGIAIEEATSKLAMRSVYDYETVRELVLKYGSEGAELRIEAAGGGLWIPDDRTFEMLFSEGRPIVNGSGETIGHTEPEKNFAAELDEAWSQHFIALAQKGAAYDGTKLDIRETVKRLSAVRTAGKAKGLLP